MAAWRLARSLETLRGQVNTAAPKRSKASDGTIGDVAHQKAGTSDHLPTRSGQVCAFDLTHDPAGGCDAHATADRLLRAQDARLKYVISNGRIGSGPAGPRPGVWRPYTGANKHTKHAHISVVAGALGDDARAWSLPGFASSASAGSTLKSATPATSEEDDLTPDQARMLAEVHGELFKVHKNRTGDPKADGRDTMAGYAINADAYGYRAERTLALILERLDYGKLAKAVADEILGRKVSAPTWRDGKVPNEDTPIASLLARAAEASITRHRDELGAGGAA